jgi:hypothetical protein
MKIIDSDDYSVYEKMIKEADLNGDGEVIYFY